jgi:G3E family GTPase
VKTAGAPPSTAAEPVPVVVLGGWLGAGKTTLVNHLLRHADGRRIAVLVNDFGEVPIDADLVEGERAAGVLALAGGCICCSFGADLVGTLERVVAADPAPDVVLVECSGVALPRAVARTAGLARGAAVEGVVVLIDAEQVRERAADPYVGETVRQQVAEADLLVVNKADLGDAAALDGWLGRCVPGVPRMAATFGRVPPDVVLGLHGADAPRARAGLGSGAGAGPLRRPAAARWQSETLALEAPVDVAALARELTAPGSGVLRAKGVLRGLDGRRWLVQVVGRRADLSPAGETADRDAHEGRLVVIRTETAVTSRPASPSGPARPSC